MKKFKIRIIPLYNSKFKLYTFHLFTIDIDREGYTLLILNISFYYGI